MSKKLEGIYKLFDLWQSYIDIIYAPEVEVNMMETMKKEGLLSHNASFGEDNLGSDEWSFSRKMQNENIETKLAALFSRNDEDEINEDIENIKSKIDDRYETANEDMTTDTPITSEGEGAQEMRTTEESAAEVASAKANKILKQQAGIVSSDEEKLEEESEVGIESSQSSQEEEDKAEPH